MISFAGTSRCNGTRWSFPTSWTCGVPASSSPTPLWACLLPGVAAITTRPMMPPSAHQRPSAGRPAATHSCPGALKHRPAGHHAHSPNGAPRRDRTSGPIRIPKRAHLERPCKWTFSLTTASWVRQPKLDVGRKRWDQLARPG